MATKGKNSKLSGVESHAWPYDAERLCSGPAMATLATPVMPQLCAFLARQRNWLLLIVWTVEMNAAAYPTE